MVTRKLYAQGEEGIIVYGYKFRPAVVVPETEPDAALRAVA
jgi:hypothetical protein